MNQGARRRLLSEVVEYAAAQGIAGKSLREIAAGVGTSHRMVLYHFGSREGLLAAIVSDMEQRQRELLSSLAASSRTPRELMTALWAELSSPRLRPFVRLFFEVVGIAAGSGTDGDRRPDDLTGPWLDGAIEAAESVGLDADPALLRAGIAVTRGLLLDLVSGADHHEVDAAHAAFAALLDRPRDDLSRCGPR